jgi:hypothetical protein
LGVVVAVLLVIGGVEVNPGPPAEQGKIDQVLTYVRNQEKEWEGCQQRTEERFRRLYEERRKNNILIFGLHEGGEENYVETLEMTVRFLRDTMGVEVSKETIDYLTRLGRRRGEWPILVRFTSFSKKLEVVRNKKNLAGTKIRVDEDLSVED